ncbi:MAG TPA: sigma-70 family RNA polymerase sigma factor [Fimbriiglobus sp.]
MAGEGLPPAVTPPEPTPADRGHLGLLYFFLRVQLPALRFARDAFDSHLVRAFGVYLPKAGKAVAWAEYLAGLYPLDWAVCVGCLEGSNAAWDMLFAARTGRSDNLLVDALRARAARLYPRDEEKQETAVTEFWSHLLVPDGDGSIPVLARYDGQRPLAPWLIRVFQNRHLSHLRKTPGPQTLPDDDLAVPLPTRTKEDDRWHQAFTLAARAWLAEVPDGERILLGLRWRYRMSQRDVATLLGVHEGTISRQNDKLRDHALQAIGDRLTAEGWTGDDLEQFILTELGGVLTDDPRLSAEELRRLLLAKGKTIPTA